MLLQGDGNDKDVRMREGLQDIGFFFVVAVPQVPCQTADWRKPPETIDIFVRFLVRFCFCYERMI